MPVLYFREQPEISAAMAPKGGRCAGRMKVLASSRGIVATFEQNACHTPFRRK
jgi:hypothetical protein